MATNTNIPYADKSWNFVVGCNRVSAGCRECYAEKWAWRMLHNPAVQHVYAGTVEKTEAGNIRWTGQLNYLPNAVQAPLRWNKPQTVFVNTMSDFFHEKMEEAWLDEAWWVMRNARHHRYLIFTKRPERIKDFLTYERMKGDLSHIWFIVSVEDEKAADQRIPLLWHLPERVNIGISFEPLLGPIDLERFVARSILPYKWAIIGGESGAGARPAKVGWYQHLIEFHRAEKVPVYMKQYGSVLAKRFKFKNAKGEDPLEWGEFFRIREYPF